MLIIFVIGAAGYSALELVWRGYTHWTMALTGGICFMLLFLMNRSVHVGLIIKSFYGMLIISCVEFLVGMLVNVRLGWNVWDYSALPMNLMGQVCLPYSALWFLLCIPVLKLCDALAFAV